MMITAYDYVLGRVAVRQNSFGAPVSARRNHFASRAPVLFWEDLTSRMGQNHNNNHNHNNNTTNNNNDNDNNNCNDIIINNDNICTDNNIVDADNNYRQHY